MADGSPEPASKARLAALSLLALGVVYGDIGTSPLYALREAFSHGLAATPANVLGILSLVVWSLVLIVTAKYLVLVVRADNRGEGGILALMALVHSKPKRRLVAAGTLGAGLFGAALLYGDGMITPAISVLSAVEGIALAAPAASHLVVPITLGILAVVFWVQRHGTRGVGRVFGPVTLLWFVALFALGLNQVARNPVVLHAFDPRHAAVFFVEQGWAGFAVLGSVFLVVTGGETLYADLGHFGRRPIRWAWAVVVLPALLMNYMGQGALVLADPAAAANPFYALAPSWGLVPLVVLATAATIIASQAVITGAFSLTYQAVHLGYLPRLRIRHTSADEAGQIYVPLVNWLLFVACVYLVTTFGSSGSLAGAYGLAVSTTMVLTTLLMAVVARQVWRWPLPLVAVVLGAFLLIEAAYLGANALKFFEGGWFPLAVAAGVLAVMATWRTGRAVLRRALSHERLDLAEFVRQQRDAPTLRSPGTAVYMTPDPAGPPPALLRNLEHHGALHERVILLTVVSEEVPHILLRKRVHVRDLGQGFWQVIAHYGFMEEPHVPRILQIARHEGLEVDVAATTFFVGIERIVSTPKHSGMAHWRERLFAFMVRNAQRPSMFFHLPRERVIEVGIQVEI